MDFYSKYRVKCTEKGFSATAAAALAGISRTSVSRWKKGIAKPTPANLTKKRGF